MEARAAEGVGGPSVTGRRVAYVARRLALPRLTAVLLVVAVAVTAGGSMAAVVAARQAQHSLAAFIDWSRPEDAGMYADPARSSPSARSSTP